ncbi:Ger(x)C family spore germination protein [Cohnella sp. REN36]|uniref:Ger(x)C family spore germination protein n=1 Tax=Cohnella sp. REN36 TaxID=2887347 RepID=UPI001D15723F|nr:Ger(x)C family spore germination protein [Cohnella sp. REN36]MCC3373964.1 Ger(x)C family spore germination protein [Cohnella sp. REN36]
MRSARNSRFILFFLFVCLMLAGCWDRREMDEIALVMASGTDMTDDGQVELTLQIALPIGMPGMLQSSGKGKNPFMTVSEKGANVHELIGQLQERLSRKIFFGHRAVVIIGESFARHGIDQVLDSLLRFPESRYNSYILTTHGVSAKELLQAPYQMEVIPAIGMKTLQTGGYGTAVKIDEFLDAVSTHEIQPFTGAIRSSMKEGETGFQIDQTAVYRNNKLVGYLSGEHLKAFKMMDGQARGQKLTVRLEPEKPFTKGTLTVEFLHFQKKIRTFTDQGRLRTEVAVHAAVRAVSNDTTLDLSKPPDHDRAERVLLRELNDQIVGLIAQTQKDFKSDVIGFARELHVQHPEAWKKLKKGAWLQAYPQMDVRVNTDLNLERIGRTNKSGHLLE